MPTRQKVVLGPREPHWQRAFGKPFSMPSPLERDKAIVTGAVACRPLVSILVPVRNPERYFQVLRSRLFRRRWSAERLEESYRGPPAAAVAPERPHG
jgi:hypothetical protein